MKKFVFALGYTFVRFVGIYFLFYVFCFVLFLISYFIFYLLPLFGDLFGEGENFLSVISVTSISMCFLATFCVYYKTKYRGIIAKKLRYLTALRTNMWLWRNFYFMVSAWYLYSGLFGNKDYEIKDNLAFCFVNLAIFIIFCIFGKFTESTMAKTEQQAALVKLLDILGVFVFFIALFCIYKLQLI